MEKRGLTAALIIVVLIAAVMASFAERRIEGRLEAERLVARRALLQSLGVSSLAVTSECTLVRSLTEGLSGCLGDVPGGYCTYTSCDVVTLPDFETDFAFELRIVRKTKDGDGETP
ncbi:hypothetical protein AMJ39_02705 [candidate division TA06 bacterium DG_24]|uniref:Uncharacterized protein n=3 Tax=Bacteria division TA06 TaxID=1156500 RepID=A0A0S8JMH5_UNCT6|nr:MAG: hypothetical protein AMJ39_02705 [candidate division TA06 bacterium DG_24]KPK69696.1 MAG: hypothetical protein AMJ82_04975 [candidate division TA06 bacterium SM23_40]KPL10720.1 MAG: hypothetical protein AMJ71_02200 [candidate division TA06 bacterium SM1_40]